MTLRQVIVRWLKTVLVNVGVVDTTKFTAQRAASSRLNTRLGASVTEIMNCGNWKSNSVWRNSKKYAKISFEQRRTRPTRPFWATFWSAAWTKILQAWCKAPREVKFRFYNRKSKRIYGLNTDFIKFSNFASGQTELRSAIFFHVDWRHHPPFR